MPVDKKCVKSQNHKSLASESGEASTSIVPFVGDASSSVSVRPRPPLFLALGRQEPPSVVQIRSARYRLAKVFKHDSWALTALYVGARRAVVCKFHRQQRIGPVPMKWLGRRLARREVRMLQRLADVPNVPRWSGFVCVDDKPLPYAVAHEFIPGHPLGKRERVRDAFFSSLRETLGEMHRRGMAYVDLHKRENILVGEDGQPYLFDFQISRAPSDGWLGRSWLTRALLRMLQRSDQYHLEKHVLHCRPDQCGFQKTDLVAQRPWWIRLHRSIAVPFRFLRRRLLVALSIRTGRGRVETEYETEDAFQAAVNQSRTAA